MKITALTVGILFLHLLTFSQIPAGYYNSASGLTGTALQLALHNIIKNHTVVSYTPGVWNAFYTTDDRPDGTAWDMYADIPNGTPPYTYTLGSGQCGTQAVTNEGICYSREHSWPKSWFGGEVSPMFTDLFHIVPVDQYVNNAHSNYPYGEVGTASFTSLNGSKLGNSITPGYTGTVFEPIDEYKGDFARNYFYMEVRYYTEDGSWPGSPMAVGSQLLPWAQDMMTLWAQQDPVSQKEIDRNEAVFAIQHNRNPFIDHPEYVGAIWGSSTSVNPEPTNFPLNFCAHNIYLQWNDATGQVLPDGYLIKMSAVGFSSITDPVDGVPVTNTTTEKNVSFASQGCWFTNLTPNTPYYFKIYAYTGSGNSINYKTDAVPQVQKNTQP